MKNKSQRNIFVSFAVFIFFIAVFFLFGFFSTWKNKLNDNLFITDRAHNDIVIVSIDDKSLKELGRWPWDRLIHADLIEKISSYKPAVIGVDINFSENSDEENDLALSQSFSEAGNVVLPIETEFDTKTKRAISVTRPIEILEKASSGLGFVNMFPGNDGFIRKIPFLIYGENGDEYKSFAQAVVERYQSHNNQGLEYIPLSDKNNLALNFIGDEKSFRIISAFEIFKDEIDLKFLKDKIVLIGVTAPDLHDKLLVPNVGGQPLSGVLIHATAINTIIKQNYIRPMSDWLQIFIFITVSFLIIFLSLKNKIFYGFILMVIMLFLYTAFASVLFDRGIVVDLFYGFLTIVLSLVASVAIKYLIALQQKSEIKNFFSKYVSPEILKELLKDPEKIRLGGVKKELSILFSDIRGFTTISERLSPEKLVELLNEYLSAMTNIIMQNKGVVDKYIGDAVMAFWGAPIKYPDHAKCVCESALLMMNVLREKRDEWRIKYKTEIKIGVGINTGEVIIGNMGSEKRFDYTIMGDPVNLAARLESATKQYNINILVSEFTKKQTDDDFVFRYIDNVAVKGKTNSVEIYELVAKRTDIAVKQIELLKNYNQGIKNFKNYNWDKAIDSFSRAVNHFPDDVPSKMYLERAFAFKNNPPKSGDGFITRLTNK